MTEEQLEALLIKLNFQMHLDVFAKDKHGEVVILNCRGRLSISVEGGLIEDTPLNNSTSNAIKSLRGKLSDLRGAPNQEIIQYLSSVPNIVKYNDSFYKFGRYWIAVNNNRALVTVESLPQCIKLGLEL